MPDPGTIRLFLHTVGILGGGQDPFGGRGGQDPFGLRYFFLGFESAGSKREFFRSGLAYWVSS